MGKPGKSTLLPQAAPAGQVGKPPLYDLNTEMAQKIQIYLKDQLCVLLQACHPSTWKVETGQ